MSIPLAMSPVGYDTWVTELKRALYNYLGQTGFEVEYLSTEKKLVINTDKVSEEEYAEVANIASEYMPAGTTLEQYNYIVPFIRLDYLESTGTQWINTGIAATEESSFSVDYTPFGRGEAPVLFGGRYGEGNVRIISYRATRPAEAVFNFGSYSHEVHLPQQQGVRHTATLSKELATLDSLQVASGWAGETFVTHNMYLYANYANLFTSSSRVYSFAIARSGVSQLNFIPCLDNTGKPCMYDTVTSTPFYNLGAEDDFDFGAKYTNELQFSKALSLLPASSTDRIFKVSVPEEVLASPLIQKLMLKCRAEKNWIIQTIN